MVDPVASATSVDSIFGFAFDVVDAASCKHCNSEWGSGRGSGGGGGVQNSPKSAYILEENSLLSEGV